MIAALRKSDLNVSYKLLFAKGFAYIANHLQSLFRVPCKQSNLYLVTLLMYQLAMGVHWFTC